MNTNRKLQNAIIMQKALIEYMESKRRLAEFSKSHAEEKLKQESDSVYWDSVRYEADTQIKELVYFLKLANEALQLLEEGIAEMAVDA